MRRKDREIKDMAEILAVVMAENVCSVAIEDQPCPYLVPMNYGAEVEDGRLVLYFHGAKGGRKAELLEKSPRASFVILGEHQVHINREVPGKSTTSFESICGSGRTEVLSGEERGRGLAILMNHLGRPSGASFSEVDFSGPSCEAAKVWRIVTDEVTGKRHE